MIVYFALALLICLASIIFISVYSYHNLKSLSNQESQSALKASFAYEMENLGYINSVHSVWTQAYENIVVEDNKMWIDSNIGEDVSKTFGIDLALILNDKSEIVHAYARGDPIGKQNQQIYEIGLAQFLSQHHTSKFNIGVIKEPMLLGDKPYIISVGEIQPSYDKATRIDSGKKTHYLVLGQEIDRSLITSLKKFSLIEELEFHVTSSTKDKPDSETTFDVQSERAYLGYFTWRATNQASKIFTQILPISISALIILVSLAALVVYNVSTAASGYDNLLTSLRTTTDDLRVAKTVAERSSHEKSKFLATMSHEIRTPMNGIVGMLSLLKETELSDQQISYVNTIENSSNALMKLIDDVLEFSQSESKEIKAFLAPVNIREIVSEIQGLLQPIAMQKSLKFEVFFSQNVPKLVETDPVRFRQILLHLTSNAFKFTKVGQVRINVSVAPLDRERFELIVQVIDTGIGISKAIQETLFSDFFSTNALNEGGTKEGLGLGIARNLVMLLKGKIDCESKLGQGSIFWFSIPIKNPEVSKKIAEEKAEQPSAPQTI